MLSVLSENAQKLIQLEEAAKAAGKGKWNPEVQTNTAKFIREVKWTVDNPRQFVDSFHQKPLEGNNSLYGDNLFLMSVESEACCSN